MNVSVRRDSLPWCLMATLQVAEDSPDLSAILADLDFDFLLEPVAAPDGLRRFNLLLNPRRGRRRCALVAHRLLGALQRIADTGDLPGFHIVAGRRWLDDPTAEDFAAPIEPERGFEPQRLSA